MTDHTLDEIWVEDRLGRRPEAALIEDLLVKQSQIFRAHGRDSSYVLALDAPYGQGKSFFLEKLTAQLRLSHPVATIDAWVDDANNEPLIAIMAAIEEALSPFLARNKKIADKFKAASRAALPIIGKAISGAASKAVQRYIGDAIFDQASAELREAMKTGGGDSTLIEDAIDKGIESAGEAITTLIDKQAEQLIADYRKRQSSRAQFKRNMCDLIQMIEQHGGEISPPLFIVVDELDRCRPHYAIRLLEEIKHFFDLSGVVFIIAMHGDQLTKSLAAVYGQEFDTQDYLRRFFTRRYQLRPLSVSELVAHLYRKWNFDDQKFHLPEMRGASRSAPSDVAGFIGLLFDSYQLTPREAFPVMDGIRLFHDYWSYSVPIELPYLISLLIKTLIGSGSNGEFRKPLDPGVGFVVDHGGRDGGISRENIPDIIAAYGHAGTQPLFDVRRQPVGQGSYTYIQSRLEAEIMALHKGYVAQNDSLRSVLMEYQDRVLLVDRLTQKPSPNGA